MDKFLRPDRFEADPSSSSAAREWKHWHRTFKNFLEAIQTHKPDKLKTLINYLGPRVYEFIADCEEYEAAISTLEKMYVKPKNEVFARHLLSTRKQQTSESLDEFLQALKQLSGDCNFQAVTAEKYKEEAVRDAFISGLRSNVIRQRLLENKTLQLQDAFDQALALDVAQKSSDSYASVTPSFSAATGDSEETKLSPSAVTQAAVAAVRAPKNSKCFFCGNNRHPRMVCPAREVPCNKCGKKGHFAKVCRSSTSATVITDSPMLATVLAASLDSVSKAVIKISINDKEVQALVDTGSCKNFISQGIVEDMSLSVFPGASKVTMATTTLTTEILGYCVLDIIVQGHVYKNIRLSVLPSLCSEVILGHEFMKQHEAVTLTFGGSMQALNICALSTLAITPPSPFVNLTPDCKPIATKSRRYSALDQQFITSEINRMLSEGIIEPSTSPWRAQVVVTTNERHKKRLVIDYSQTINKFTQLNANPLPRIDDLVNKVSQYSYFSTIDLKSAYHQVPLNDKDKFYTAFEACGQLYQFCRMPFGITNGVSCFQKVMDEFIHTNCLSDTYCYLDDITICGKTKEEHDKNIDNFMKAAKRSNLTLNYDKCTFSALSINLLGYHICKGEIKPDPERLQPLLELPLPHDMKSLRRVVGLFSYYSQWIVKFSDKIAPLAHSTSFPVSSAAQKAFDDLKKEIANSVVNSIDESLPYTVETDASDVAIAATLNQAGRPVAFFSRMLNQSEKKQSAVEKEAHAIVEAVRKWKHYLSGRHFTLITDQKSVAFMFHTMHKSNIKNDKILRWRLELADYSFDIQYRPGKQNIPSDTFSRAYCSAISSDTLFEFHKKLCHPGITRMMHFVRSRNLPYSVDDVRKVTNSCPVCAECKPRFSRPQQSSLIKATRPFERLNIDFKGPLPSNTHNQYLLTVVDEFSRFPFAYPCSNLSSQMVIKCLSQLFSIFGMPDYIHSDRGASFMSTELKEFLHGKGIVTSRTTPFNPQGNGQCERYNGIIWKTVTLALKSLNLPITRWEVVLPDALHSIRSLLSTATNTTPHERLFQYQRKTSSGHSVPTWLTKPGPVLVKRHVRQSKYDPTVEEADLLDANPQYAHVRFSDGRESTVSLRDLAPRGDETRTEDGMTELETVKDEGRQPSIVSPQGDSKPHDSPSSKDHSSPDVPDSVRAPVHEESDPHPVLRRSERVRRPVDRLSYS